MSGDNARHQRRTIAWVATLGVAAWLVFRLTGLTVGLDRDFHDLLVRAQPRTPHPDIVIVAIDDKSIAALGRWPWSRTLHADLIRRLGEAGARVVGLDMLLIDPGAADEGADHRLAQAIARNGRVVLPTMMEVADGLVTQVPPLPAFGDAALALGHVHLPVDADGLVRQIYLREGTVTRSWDHFARVMGQHAGRVTPPALAPWPGGGDTGTWIRRDPLPIAFAGPPGHFPRLSYVDVLEGETPPERLRDKLVLVGVTAAGLGDLFATPLSEQHTLMPGVEIHANVLDSLLQARTLTPAPVALEVTLNLAMVGLLALAIGLLQASPLVWIASAGAVGALGGLAAYVAQARWGVQLSPVTGLFALGTLVLAYWGYQWNLSSRFVLDELLRFRGSRQRLAGQGPLAGPSGLSLSHRLHSLRDLTQQLRDVHRFVKDSLEALPDATLVCDRDGGVQLANVAAATLAQRLGARAPENPPNDRRSRPGDALLGRPVAELLRGLRFNEGAADAVTRRLMQLPEQHASAAAHGPQERDYLIKCVPTHNAREQHTGWIVSLVDVTDIHVAQRQRDEAIGFMSHDMRAPQSAILSLLELRRSRPDTISPMQFEERVERHARKALSLADGFIHLTRAQSRDYQLVALDLAALLQECVDDAWEAAQKGGVSLHTAQSPEVADGHADRELFSRAVANLLGNAIKFSPPGGAVAVSLRAETGHWVVGVRDQGPGISAEAQAQLFTPFYRDPSVHRVDGAGLGLPFVRTVMLRHGGRVVVDSAPGAGSHFELWLPHTPIQAHDPAHGSA